MDNELKDGIEIVLLSYKEEDNLKKLIPEIRENIEKTKLDYDILVVDTQMPLDNSQMVCEEYGAKYVNQREKGFGGAFRTAIEEANRKYFFIMDSDGSHNPKYIEPMVHLFIEGNCDVVIGSRYVKGGKTFDKKSSIIMSKILNTVFRVFLGIKAHDVSTDFRMYDTAQLKKVKLQNINYDVLQEVLFKLKQNNKNLVIGELPITFEKRLYGESKRQLIPFIISYIKSLIRLTLMRITSSL